jgi:uroporphyrinogen decarboxylase
VSLDSAVPLSWAREQLQTRLPVQGNLDPLALVVGAAAMREAVQRIRAAFQGGPFVFNLGHGIVPETPPEHVAELVALVRSGAGSS